MDAAITIQQLGGMSQLRAMVNARNFLTDADTLHFTFSGYRKANKAIITLDPSDTYTLRIFSTRTMKDVHETSGIYCDSLKTVFEHATGLHLSL